MSTRSLAILVAILAGLVLADAVLRDGAGLLFLAKKLLDLVEYLVFWR
jgi:hypothetical protein